VNVLENVHNIACYFFDVKLFWEIISKKKYLNDFYEGKKAFAGYFYRRFN